MKKKLEPIVGSLFLLSLVSCGDFAPTAETDEMMKDSKTATKPSYTEEEKVLFAEKGTNSLGVATDDYDYAIVVGNSTLSLLQDGAATEAAENEATGNADEAKSNGEDGANSTNADNDEGEEEKTDEAETEDEADVEGEDDSKVEAVTAAELEACSKYFGQTVEGLHITGDANHVDIDPAKLIAVKMSGNMASINLLLTKAEEPAAALVEQADQEVGAQNGQGGAGGNAAAETGKGAQGETDKGAISDDVAVQPETVPVIDENADVAGICIVASGNQPTANVVIDGTSVGAVYYIASGNGATANFEVKEGSSIGSFAATLKGNAGSLTVTGSGEYTCDNIAVSGNAITPTCGE